MTDLSSTLFFGQSHDHLVVDGGYGYGSDKQRSMSVGNTNSAASSCPFGMAFFSSALKEYVERGVLVLGSSAYTPRMGARRIKENRLQGSVDIPFAKTDKASVGRLSLFCDQRDTPQATCWLGEALRYGS
jgi:hypothetical protein